MIRGAIETANRTVISGWLYARAVDLRGQLVLAFIGDRHVGTGRIELFRKDILEAGLGDGYSGFHFPVDLRSSDEPQTVTIRLEQSDLSLLQRDVLIVPAASPPENRPIPLTTPGDPNLQPLSKPANKAAGTRAPKASTAR